MKMLITGYKGLLGSTVARQMNGIATEVLAVSSENRYETWPKDRKTRLLKDLDYVFWFGSSITPANAKSSVEEQSLEIHEFKLLIDDLKQLSDRAVVILASSGGSLYDKNEPPYSESSEIVPNNTYGTFKLQQEELLRSETDLRHLILRFSNIYGIGQRTGRGLGVIAEWCKASYFDRAVEVFGSLEKERDFVYVEDAVAAIARYVRLPRKPDTLTLNIGSGESTSLARILEIIEEISGKKVKIDYMPSRDIDRDRFFLDISKAQTLLDWKVTTDLKTGIQKIWEQYSNNEISR